MTPLPRVQLLIPFESQGVENEPIPEDVDRNRLYDQALERFLIPQGNLTRHGGMFNILRHSQFWEPLREALATELSDNPRPTFGNVTTSARLIMERALEGVAGYEYESRSLARLLRISDQRTNDLETRLRQEREDPHQFWRSFFTAARRGRR
jgi:hypothetical protein